MKYCIVDAAGRWTGACWSGPDEARAINTPDGCSMLDGAPAALIEAGAMQPPLPPPVNDLVAAWDWNENSLRYEPLPTMFAIEQAARAERAQRLTACDWIVTRSAERGEPVPEAWRQYRQALRDVTAQPGWPTEIAWPAPPA
jgi:hypothetical protein